MKLIAQPRVLIVAQSKYTATLVTELGLSESVVCKVPCDTLKTLSTSGDEVADEFFPHRQLIVGLLYILYYTNPDVVVVTSILARDVERSSLKHQKAPLKAVNYLYNTTAYALKLQSEKSLSFMPTWMETVVVNKRVGALQERELLYSKEMHSFIIEVFYKSV